MIMEQPFPQSALEAIAKLCGNLPIGDKETTGSQIAHYLESANLPDPDPGDTKWKRVYKSFVRFQNENQTSNNIIIFLRLLYSPCRYAEHKGQYYEEVAKLNRILSMQGLELKDDGKMHRVGKAETLSEALKRAQRLKEKLLERNVHPIILKYAENEILSDNYFHTVLEAMKSVTVCIREKTGCYADGVKLVDSTLTGDTPRIVINNYITDSEKGEQKGFVNLLKGLYGTFRNPLAHESKIEWHLSEQDALDVLCMISYVHRKLEKAR